MSLMSALFSNILQKLQDYKKRVYLNGLLRGLIFFFTLFCSAYLLVTFLEYYGQYNSSVRFGLLSSFIILTIFGFVKWIYKPLAGLLTLRNQMSDEEAAKEIGRFFPDVQDKLLNTLQLRNLAVSDNLFIQASIDQRTKELSVIPFSEAINLKENKKHLRFLGAPLILILLVLAFLPQVFMESTARIINYGKKYSYPAPFQFNVLNKKLSGFKNEDFEVELSLNGKAIPEQIYIVSDGKRSKMKKLGNNRYSFVFKNIQSDENFLFEAAGYNSNEYLLEVFSRPDLKMLELALEYPAYLGKKNEQINNAGNITIPEGTNVIWNFTTEDVDKVFLKFSDEGFKNIVLNASGNGVQYSKRVKKSLEYKLELENKFGKGKEKIAYNINIIPDQFPAIAVEDIKDSVLFSNIAFGGSISDDYGVSKLRLFYKIVKEGQTTGNFRSITIPIHSGELSQNFIYNWRIDSLKINPGEKLQYFLQVWDNDGVNGNKSTKSRLAEFSLPNKEEIREDVNESSKSLQSGLNQTYKEAKKIKKEMDKFEEKLKTKPNFDWQDKKALEDLLKKHNELNTDIEELKNKQEELNEKYKKFNEPNEELSEKMKELEKLMDELMDEDTKKLYDELQKMLQENVNKEELQKALEEIKNKDKTMEKELERSLEWFKQLQFDQKTEQIKNDLKDLAKEQKQLSEKSQEKNTKSDELLKEQEKLNEEFKNLEKDLKDLKDLNNSLENKNELKDFGKEQEEIKENQQKGSDQLKNNQNKKAGGSQKQAAEQMQQLSDKLSQMQNQMEKEELEENMHDLRAILDNLIKLSFDQEQLLKDFRKVNQSDPRYLDLSQKQLKLKEDSRIIEDSLNALAKRVFQIQAFITREVGEMNEHMDASIKNIRDRRPDLASANQQYSMTSINNLALLLNDVLKQMQQQMAAQQQNQGGSMCKKPGKNSKPGLGEMQKQLNEKMSQMKNGQKPGESMSKEIAKMAAQQEMIRNALKELQKKAGMGEKSGKELSELMKQMEQTEKDLVNKRFNQETMMRQKEILTRLLEAENSLRERDTDSKRESNTAKDLNRNIPPNLEKYLKEKEKQTELLKTVNPAYTPYYRKEVDEYFQKIENDF